VDPDLVICMGFPWKVPPDALAVPCLGWLNGHPSLLPLHRGPLPVAWAIRSGDEEVGITFHRMDAELDTGPIFSQRRFPLGDLEGPDTFYGRFAAVIGEALFEALERLAAGDDGTSQGEAGSYESFFTADDAWLDLPGPRRRSTGSSGHGSSGSRPAARAVRCSSSTACRSACSRRR
jgi:methionyl-tRNA formyltransferase